MVLQFALVFLGGLLASLAITPLVRRLATRWNLVDRPDDVRKMHARTIALGGGIAVLLAAAIPLLIGLLFDADWREKVLFNEHDVLGLCVGVAILCGVGVLDDAFGLRARQKLAGQIVACLVVMSSGISIGGVTIFGTHVELGLLAWPITLFWLLGCINSVNLIDGADGLATTVGIILTSTAAAMLLMTGNVPEAIVALALVGSLLGFLVFNFPPASIFLGDAGSMTIGLMAGALALHSCVKNAATFALLGPLSLWAVPALDTGIAILRRKLTGRGICTVDRGHLHHCLLRRGYGNRQLLMWVAGLCLITSAGALLSLHYEREWYAVGAVAIVMAILLSTRVFGHAEFRLATHSVKSLGISLVTPVWRTKGAVRESSVRLQGSRQWESLWAMLVEAAETLNLASLKLNVNLPWLHESYHASWRRDDEPTADAQAWRVEIPLNAAGRSMGILKVSGHGEMAPVAQRLAKFSELLDSVEEQLLLLAGEPISEAAPRRPARLPLTAKLPEILGTEAISPQEA